MSVSPGRRIAVVCPYPEGRAPSQRLKYEQYFPSWRAEGFEVEVFSFWDEEAWGHLYRTGSTWDKAAAVMRGMERRRRTLPRILSADLIYLHLEATPIGPPWVERALLESGIPLVYDIDDLVHLPHGSPANPFMRHLRSSGKVLELMRRAAHVVVCTPYLEKIAAEHNAYVTDISSTIDTSRYLARPHRSQPPLTVGWSGSHSTAPYLHLLDDVLREVSDANSLRVLVIGADTFEIDGVDVEVRPWVRESEVDDLSEIDIGVYPLPNEEWILGKSGLKALQYMGLAIPTVAQDAGAAHRIIEHGRTGLLAHTPSEWVTALRTLLHDDELRRSMGEAGRDVVVKRYSVEANTDRYLAVLHQVLTDRPKEGR